MSSPHKRLIIEFLLTKFIDSQGPECKVHLQGPQSIPFWRFDIMRELNSILS